ncbi:site-specific integrase [Gluconobacter aidae]|uniref:Tyrosine-type recombinase/integrase n=1 Tax=Gluconobacter aidae TaxID=2662454 RepID=A0A7X1VNT8_9PROT|nr:site-specific integrase [Gluconobacter aidae]MQS00139.1 tyrosine-type recombinase/integrase [Gluconobacter aidae]
MTLQSLFPEPFPAVLQGASDRLLLAARSPATLRAYRTDWSAFVAWCRAQGVMALPAQPETVSAWIASRLEQGRKAATLTRGVAAVSCAHELAGFESFSRSRIVQDALRGMRRTLGTAPTRKAPATVDLLRRMLDVQPDTLIGWRNRALLALGFAGALRRSELVTLEVGDLVPQEGGALLTLRRSKTDPDGAGQTIGILNGSTIRALDQLAAWCEAAEVTSGRLLRSVDRHGRVGRSLSDRSVARIIKAAAEAVGLDPERFSGHSLRAGFITSGAEAGADALMIAETSRHQSLDVLRSYVRRASLLKTHAGHRFL